jgi:hypothetical protein
MRLGDLHGQLGPLDLGPCAQHLELRDLLGLQPDFSHALQLQGEGDVLLGEGDPPLRRRHLVPGFAHRGKHLDLAREQLPRRRLGLRVRLVGPQLPPVGDDDRLGDLEPDLRHLARLRLAMLHGQRRLGVGVEQGADAGGGGDVDLRLGDRQIGPVGQREGAGAGEGQLGSREHGPLQLAGRCLGRRVRGTKQLARVAADIDRAAKRRGDAARDGARAEPGGKAVRRHRETSPAARGRRTRSFPGRRKAPAGIPGAGAVGEGQARGGW